MRGKSKTSTWFLILLSALSFPHFAHAQTAPIPLNHRGLPVISTIKQYKNSVNGVPIKRMVAVENYIRPLFTQFVYATASNFTNNILYRRAAPYVRIEAAEALQKVQADLSPLGLSLLIFDAYRPYSITEKMWEIVPDDRYAANPANGSGHNRGAAVDVSLADLVTGKQLLMPTAFDDFTEKAHHSFAGLGEEPIKNRELLRWVMEKHGFVALETEWWHYSLPGAAKKYELMDLNFRKMKRLVKRNAE